MNLNEFVNKSSKLKDEVLVDTFENFCDELKELGKINGADWINDLIEFGCLDTMVDFEAEDGFGTEGFLKGEL